MEVAKPPILKILKRPNRQIARLFVPLAVQIHQGEAELQEEPSFGFIIPVVAASKVKAVRLPGDAEGLTQQLTGKPLPPILRADECALQITKLRFGQRSGTTDRAEVEMHATQHVLARRDSEDERKAPRMSVPSVLRHQLTRISE